MAQNKIKFGKWEAVASIIIALCTQIYLNFPRFMVEIGGTAGWIICIYITILAFLGFSIIAKLYTKFEGKDLLDIGEHIGGDAGRIIVGVILLAHFLFIISVILREFSEDMKVIALPASPISFVTIFFIGIMVIGSYIGLETIVRLNAIIVPIIIITSIIIFIGVAPYYDITNIFPILGLGPTNIFGRGFFKLSSFSGIITLFMIYPFIKDEKSFKTIGKLSIMVSGFFFFISTFVYLLVFRYKASTENFLPVFSLSRLINYGRVFQRIESIFVFAWDASAFLYLTQGLFFITYIFKKTFKLQYIRPLIIPFAIIVFTISLMPPNLMSVIDLELNFFRSTAWITAFIFPFVLLLIAGLVKKNKRKGAAKG